MEIIKIFFTFIAFTIFKYLSWLQIGLLFAIINTVFYFYTNKNDIKKHIKELNGQIGFKNGLLIICYGVPLMLIDFGLLIIQSLKNLWGYFITTTIGSQIHNLLVQIDNFIINKKNEMKNNMINMLMKNAMSGLGNMGNNNNNSKNNNMPNFPAMPFGNMPDINDLLKNPDKMNDMMQNFNSLMNNMNNNKKKSDKSQIYSSSATSEMMLESDKPLIDDDLFNQINNYIDDNDNSETIASDESSDNKEALKKTILETKKINKKLRKRKKSKVSEKEFNDVQNMTLALEEVLNQLKRDN